MADIDLAKMSRKEALQFCMETFGMDETEADRFVSLARGENGIGQKAFRLSGRQRRDALGKFASASGGALAAHGVSNILRGYGKRGLIQLGIGSALHYLPGKKRSHGAFAAGAGARVIGKYSYDRARIFSRILKTPAWREAPWSNKEVDYPIGTKAGRDANKIRRDKLGRFAKIGASGLGGLTAAGIVSHLIRKRQAAVRNKRAADTILEAIYNRRQRGGEYSRESRILNARTNRRAAEHGASVSRAMRAMENYNTLWGRTMGWNKYGGVFGGYLTGGKAFRLSGRQRRDRLGRFASYAGSFAAGVGQSLGPYAAGHAIRRSMRKADPLTQAVAGMGAGMLVSRGSGGLASHAQRGLGKRNLARAQKLQILGQRLGRTAAILHMLSPVLRPLGRAAYRGARRGWAARMARNRARRTSIKLPAGQMIEGTYRFMEWKMKAKAKKTKAGYIKHMMQKKAMMPMMQKEVAFKHPGHPNQKVHASGRRGGGRAIKRTSPRMRTMKKRNQRAMDALDTTIFRGRFLNRIMKELAGEVAFKHPGHPNQGVHGGKLGRAASAAGRGIARVGRVAGRALERSNPILGAAARGGRLQRKISGRALKLGARAARGTGRATLRGGRAVGRLARSGFGRTRRVTGAIGRAYGRGARRSFSNLLKEASASLFVFKSQADGQEPEYRWVLLSSNGYRDRDGEIISTKALQRDVALWELEGSPPQPLRWWHASLDDAYQKGLELGKTDFRAVHEHTLVESGVFLTKEIAEGVYNAQKDLGGSVGFRYSTKNVNSDKVFESVHIFERSLLPRAEASNVLTHLTVV